MEAVYAAIKVKLSALKVAARGGQALGMPTLESASTIAGVLRRLSESQRVVFYDLGSGAGNVVFLAAMEENVIGSHGYEIDAKLHEVALEISKEQKIVAMLHSEDVMKLDELHLPADVSNLLLVIYAFDPRYPDELVSHIFDIFNDVKDVPVLLFTTKNEQGLGAAMKGKTSELNAVTEDAILLLQEEDLEKDEREELAENLETIETIRADSIEAYEAKARDVTRVTYFDLYFGEPYDAKKEDAVVVVSPSYENETEEITKEFATKILEEEERQSSTGSKKKATLETIKMHVFSRNAKKGDVVIS